MSTKQSHSPTINKLIRKHPLQRLAAPSRGASAFVHIAGLISFAYSFNYLATHPNKINQSYGWHFQYLTIIGLALSTLTFTAGLLADALLSRRLFLLKNGLSICSAPMSLLISMLYWGLRAIDPQLVVPKELELPLMPDLGFHANPTIFLLVDILFLSPPWTITALPALGLSLTIAFAYWFWIELCYTRNNFYPYPLFEILNYQQRVALFVGSAIVMAAGTGSLRWVYGRVNGMEAQSKPGDIRAGKKQT